MNVFVTGGAGFIGSHVVDMFLKNGLNITVMDEMLHGDNLHHLEGHPNLRIIRSNINDVPTLRDGMKGMDAVYHLVANSDVQKGGKDPNLDFENTLLTTKNVLDVMVLNNIKKIFFASTSAVYGNRPGVALREDSGSAPISYYGASKVASEALISSYAHMNDLSALVFRLPNVIGPRLTHGVIFDFMQKLKDDPKKLRILGNGKQTKEYIHVYDVIKAMEFIPIPSEPGMEVYNVGTESTTSVIQIADIVCESMGYKDVEYIFTGGDAGWKGDVPLFKYDISKIKGVGWTNHYSSTDAVRKTLKNLME